MEAGVVGARSNTYASKHMLDFSDDSEQWNALANGTEFLSIFRCLENT